MDDCFSGTTAVCFVFNFCLLCSQRLPVSDRNLPVPKPFLNKFLKYVLKDRIKIYRKKSYRFKTWMEFVRQILMKLKTSSNEGLLLIKVFSHSLMWLSKHCSGHYLTTQACTLISWGCVHLRWCGSLEDDTLWYHVKTHSRKYHVKTMFVWNNFQILQIGWWHGHQPFRSHIWIFS